MCDSDSSYELLSSMSPKLKKNDSRNKHRKSPHKLALRNNIRRTSIYDKIPKTYHVTETSIIVINDSLRDLKITRSPIIISSTSESEEEEFEEIERVENNPVAKSKLIEINNWFCENEKLDEYSEVNSFHNDSLSESDDGNLNISKTSKVKEETEQKSPSGVWKVTSIESKLGKEPLRTKDKNFKKPKCSSTLPFQIEDNATNSEIDNRSDTSETEKIASKLLDDLYGTSWRANKEQILTRTEPRKPIKPSLNTRLLKTEKKQKLVLLPRSITTYDSDTSNEDTSSSESYKSTKRFQRIKLNFSESEDESNFSSNMTPTPSINKINTKNKKNSIKNRSSSPSSNINFNENDSDSLRTRIKKRLVKKPQINDTTKNKTKIDTKDEKTKNTSNLKTVNYKKSETLTKKNQENDNFGYEEQKCSFLKSLSGGLPLWQSDPDAVYYKTNYKTTKSMLAKKLFQIYNDKIFQNVIPTDTQIEWNERMRGTAGFCYNKRITKSDGRVFRSCRIVLATKILDTADRLRDTLVHEMCHAATWLINNVADGHGPYWKSWAEKARKTFPELPPIKRCHEYQINTKYTYKCMECGYSVGRHSKSLDIERKRCGYCYGKFEIFINKVNKNGEKQALKAASKGKATGFALFVKENYNLVKTDNMKHGQVMKILGQKFSELKIVQNSK